MSCCSEGSSAIASSASIRWARLAKKANSVDDVSMFLIFVNRHLRALDEDITRFGCVIVSIVIDSS